jgi:hypothetical protein
MPGATDAAVQEHYHVPPELLKLFRQDGVVVLPGVFTEHEVEEAKAGLAETLLQHGVVST